MNNNVERPMVRLPCGHLADRPERNRMTVDCPACPRRYALHLDEHKVWNAREEEVTVP